MHAGKECSAILFNDKDLVEHVPPKKFEEVQELGSRKKEYKEAHSFCNSYFIKRKEWGEECDGNTGRILCPRKTVRYLFIVCAVRVTQACGFLLLHV